MKTSDPAKIISKLNIEIEALKREITEIKNTNYTTRLYYFEKIAAAIKDNPIILESWQSFFVTLKSETPDNPIFSSDRLVAHSEYLKVKSTQSDSDPFYKAQMNTIYKMVDTLHSLRADIDKIRGPRDDYNFYIALQRAVGDNEKVRNEWLEFASVLRLALDDDYFDHS